MSNEKIPEKLVSLYHSSNRLMNDAIDRLVVKLYIYKHQYQKNTILLSGCGTRNGTTMIAINLAVALAGAGWSTLLVDADMRKRMKYKRLNSDIAGLSDYLEGDAEVTGIICPTDKEKLYYVKCGEPKTNAVRLLSSRRMLDFVSTTSDKFDFVVFDCPSLTVVPDATVLFSSVDLISLVLALNCSTKKQLARAKQEIAKYDDKYAGLIVNRVDRKQYKNAFPQHNYFEEGNIRKLHLRALKKVKDKE